MTSLSVHERTNKEHCRQNAVISLQLGAFSNVNNTNVHNECTATGKPNIVCTSYNNEISPINGAKNISNNSADSCCYEIMYWITRFFFVSASFCFTILTACYGISNITTINAINFFCPIYSAQQVYQHNIANNNTQGEDETSCWVINRLRLNSVAVEDLSLGLYTAEIKLFDDLDDHSCMNININIIAFLIFCIMTMYSFIIAIENLYFIIYDLICFYILKKFNPRIVKIQKKHQRKNLKQLRDSNSNINQRKSTNYNQNINQNTGMVERDEDNAKNESRMTLIKNRLVGCMCCMCTSYRRYFYNDSKYTIFKNMIGEIFEISVQLYGLLLYGGINLFDMNNIPLAQEYYVIFVFSVIIAANCVFVGLGWMTYICIHNTCHGTLFFGSLFFIDIIFDIMYVLFPLIYLTNYQNEFVFSLRRLGLLRESNPFVLVQVLSATLFSILKINRILNKLDPAYIEHCYLNNIERVKRGSYILRKPWIVTKQWKRFHQNVTQLSMSRSYRGDVYIRRMQPSLFVFVDKLDAMIQTRFRIHISTANINTYATSSVVSYNNVKDAMAYAAFQERQFKQKLIVILCGLLFILIGGTQIVAITMDMNSNFIPKCIDNNSSTINSWQQNHNEIELIYLPFCTKKVVNLFNEYSCNCRQFKIDDDNVQQDSNLAKSIVTQLPDAFQRWTMLEAFYINFGDSNFDQSLPTVNFTEKELNLKYLRIFNCVGLSIGLIDASIDRLITRLGMYC